MIFMATQFYRKAAVCAILATASLSVAQTAGSSSTPKERTQPRALSVLEMNDKGQTRLVPVTILVQDRFYDASQYQANPVPMAAEGGTVYQVLKSNTPYGWFTIEQAAQQRGNWVSVGKFKQQAPEQEKKPGKVEVDLGKDSEDRPVLKRHAGSSSDSSADSKDSKASDSASKSSESSKSSGPDDPDRPTLKRPESQTASSDSDAKPTTNSTPSIAKRSAAPVDTDLSHDTNEADPDRPVLRKTKEGTNPTDVAMAKMTPPVGPPQAAAPPKVAPQPTPEAWKAYIAISDPEKADYRPFAYDLKPDEKTAYAGKMQKIAALSLQKWALGHGGRKLPASLTFTDFDLRAFDVDYSNNPELVFTASYTPTVKTTPVTYYLTVVGRADANGDVNPIFSQVTDSTRLDAYARLELIDAVDADGRGRGSLLFREYNDSGKAFVLYRVDAYNLTKLFEGASGE